MHFSNSLVIISFIPRILWQVNIYQMFTVCYDYNDGLMCKKGSKCRRLHICNLYIQWRGNCPDGSACDKRHNFRQLKVIKSLTMLQAWSDQELVEFTRKCTPNVCEMYLRNECQLGNKCLNVCICHLIFRLKPIYSQHRLISCLCACI